MGQTPTTDIALKGSVMKLHAFAATCVLAFCAHSAMANEPASAQPEQAKAPPAADPASDANRKICRQEKPMGSLIPTRVCKTAAQWEEAREQSRKMMQDMQQRTGSTYTR
jgi:hypothetical protein